MRHQERSWRSGRNLTIIRAYAQGEIELLAPFHLPYEVTNAVLQAVRRGRISLDLEIPIAEVDWSKAFELAHTYERSAYDGAYLALAEEISLVTGDRRLYNAVKSHLPWVIWIGDYPES